MANRILEIVVYLMGRARENRGGMPDIDLLSPDLRRMGYSEVEISSAYSWVIDRFEAAYETCFKGFPIEHASNRVLTRQERLRIDPPAFGYLLKLVNLRVIDDEQFESVLERALAEDERLVTLDLMKQATSAVLFDDMSEADSLAILDAKIDSTLNVN